MATAMERKFTSLRKRLDQMGYRQPLGVESLPLAERLFGDLLHTTESLKNAKLQLGKQKEQKGLWEKQSEPYRVDNARLVKENCEVHQQLLTVKEGFEGRIRDLKAVLRRLEHENADLKFLNTQYMQRLMAQEKESQSKSEKILELQEKNFQAVIQTPGGRKKQVAFRRQRMEIDSLLPETKSVPTRSVSESSSRLHEPDPYVADLLKVADDRIANLQKQLNEGEVEKKSLQENIHELKKQVDRRENEVQRLTRQLNGGRPPEALASENKAESNDRMVAHMNIQIDFLQERNQELEAKLAEGDAAKSELQVRADDLASKNARICSELKEIGQLVRQMEAERESGEGALKEEVEEKRRECRELKSRGDQLTKEKKELEKREQQLVEDNQRMAELLATAEGDSEQAADLLEKLNKEKRSLAQDCQKLRKKGEVLQLKVDDLEREKERWKRRSGGKVGSGQQKRSSELSRAKEDRDELVRALARMEQDLAQSQEELENIAEERDNIKLLYEQVTEHLFRSHRDPSTSPGTATLLNHHERERADLQLELRRVKSERNSLKQLLQASKEGRPSDVGGVLRSNEELKKRLDEVTQQLGEERNRVASLQSAVHQLEGELKRSNTELSSVQEERRRVRERANRLQGMVDAWENSTREQQQGALRQSANIESARAEVVRVTARLGHLERMVAEKEEKVKELSEALLVLDQNHDGLRAECDRKDERIAQLNQLVEEKTTESAAKDTAATQLQGQIAHSQTQLATRDQEIASLRRQLAEASNEVAHLKEERGKVNETATQLKQDLKTMTHETQALRAELQRVEEEKERLKRRLEEHIRNIAQYEEALAVKEQEKAALAQSCQSLSEQAQHLGSTMQLCQEQESTTQLHMAALQQEKKHLEELSQQQAVEIQQHLASLQAYEIQLSNTTRSLSSMEHTVRQEQDEKKALLTDLSAMRDLCVQVEKTKESLSRQLASLTVTHESLQHEWADMEAERELLKQQLTSECTKVEQLESLLSSERRKEYHSHMTVQERQSELQHVRKQLERLENDRLQLSEQLRRLRADNVVKSEEIQHLKAELTTEKFQKQHIQQQVNKLRSALPLSSSPPHSPLSHPHTSPHITSRTASSPTTPPLRSASDVEEAIAKERESLASESARLVSELSSTSKRSEEQT